MYSGNLMQIMILTPAASLYSNIYCFGEAVKQNMPMTKIIFNSIA